MKKRTVIVEVDFYSDKNSEVIEKAIQRSIYVGLDNARIAAPQEVTKIEIRVW